MAERGPEIAREGTAEEGQVLQPQRPVEAELTAQRHQLVHGRIAREHGGGGVAGQPQRGKDERRDAKGDEGRVENLAKNVAHHL